MDPDTFLSQDDVPLLVQALNTFAFEVDAASSRKEILVNVGIHLAFRSKLIFETSSSHFASKLAAYFREYRVSAGQPTYHPMVNLLEYLLRTHELEDQDRSLFNRLVKQGQENFGGLTARCSVGRIEVPPGTAFGTGVLVGRQLLRNLTQRMQDHVDQLGSTASPNVLPLYHFEQQLRSQIDPGKGTTKDETRNPGHGGEGI